MYNKQYYISQKNAAKIGAALGYSEHKMHTTMNGSTFDKIQEAALLDAIKGIGLMNMAYISKDMFCRVARHLGFPVRRVTNQWVTNSGVVL